MFDFMKFQSSKTMVNLTLMTFSSSSQMFFSFTHSKKRHCRPEKDFIASSTKRSLYIIIKKIHYVSIIPSRYCSILTFMSDRHFHLD